MKRVELLLMSLYRKGFLSDNFLWRFFTVVVGCYCLTRAAPDEYIWQYMLRSISRIHAHHTMKCGCPQWDWRRAFNVVLVFCHRLSTIQCAVLCCSLLSSFAVNVFVYTRVKAIHWTTKNIFHHLSQNVESHFPIKHFYFCILKRRKTKTNNREINQNWFSRIRNTAHYHWLNHSPIWFFM